MSRYKTTRFPASRIASIDVCDIGKQKHHVSALIEMDVTQSREKIRQLKISKSRISFTAWLIKVISLTIREVLSMTILMDHDVIDGALMARFISDLTKNIENGKGL
ncbi:MAG: hypothetical protein EA393_13100 [Bacteroidetes bacterium]|nr:MAG: hypothetical protein EA393_13100 [Bacteroidota bacterium]